MDAKTISNAQRITFVADYWPKICALKNWDKNFRPIRINFISSAIGRSVETLLEVGKLEEYDRLKAACLAILKPDDLHALVKVANQDLTRARHAVAERIEQLAQYMRGPTPDARATAGEHYALAILRNRFHTEDVTTLDHRTLIHLRNTLDRCIGGLKKKASHPQQLAGNKARSNNR